MKNIKPNNFVYIYFVFYFTGKSRQRIAVQLQEARDKFSDVAESHARALQVKIKN